MVVSRVRRWRRRWRLTTKYNWSQFDWIQFHCGITSLCCMNMNMSNREPWTFPPRRCHNSHVSQDVSEATREMSPEIPTFQLKGLSWDYSGLIYTHTHVHTGIIHIWSLQYSVLHLMCSHGRDYECMQRFFPPCTGAKNLNRHFTCADVIGAM